MDKMGGRFIGASTARCIRRGWLTRAKQVTMRLDWQKLHALAREEVQTTLTALPAPLRDRAQALPVTFERHPNAALRRDGIERDTLGLFVGPEFGEEETASLPLPPQIIPHLETTLDPAA